MVSEEGIIAKVIILAAVALGVLLILFSATGLDDSYKEFTTECQKDRKPYECETLWRMRRY
jgi:hypothetical protein